jgi:hypothetical protein
MKKKISTYWKKSPIYLIIIFLFIGSPAIIAQDRTMHNEIEDDAYIPVDKESMERGPSYNVRRSDFFTSQVNVDSNGNDILGDAANEPSIAVDPTNPNRIVIGWRQFDTVNSNFRQAGYGYSLDGGLTWTFPGVLDPGVFRSDPVLDFDNDGNFYYNSLQGTFECDVFKIEDGGVVWESPVPAFGGDKQWMRIDRSGGVGDSNNYSNWNSSFTTCPPGYFTRSTDGSNSFENCITIDGDPFWGTLAVGSDGTLYIVGGDFAGLVVTRSKNAKIPGSEIEWDMTSYAYLDGSLTGWTPVNPQGLLGQAWIDVDISGGAGHGNVYVLASVERESNNDPADVMFAKSTDEGITFSEPIKINTDDSTTNYQWMGTMSVAPNGRIDVIWLDTRDAAENSHDSVLYYSFSEDEGETWSDNEPISLSFDPHVGYPQQNKMGDYFDMVSDNQGAHLAWANTINGGQDVYYTHIDPDGILGTNDFTERMFEVTNYPNPFSEETTISFNIMNEEYVSVDVFDISGKKLTILFEERVSGNHKITWNGTDQNGRKLNSGLYFISINAESGQSVIKVVLQ